MRSTFDTLDVREVTSHEEMQAYLRVAGWRQTTKYEILEWLGFYHN